MNIIQKVVVSGAVFDGEGRLLIVKRTADEEVYPNIWELPGGSKEPLEPCETTLVRELKEEAGIDVRPVEVFSSLSYIVQKPDLMRDTTQIAFIAELVSSGKVTISSEHQAYAWISEDEMGKYGITPETHKIIHAAFKRVRQSK